MSGICSSSTASALLAAGGAALNGSFINDQAAASLRFCRLVLLFLVFFEVLRKARKKQTIMID